MSAEILYKKQHGFFDSTELSAGSKVDLARERNDYNWRELRFYEDSTDLLAAIRTNCCKTIKQCMSLTKNNKAFI